MYNWCVLWLNSEKLTKQKPLHPFWSFQSTWIVRAGSNPFWSDSTVFNESIADAQCKGAFMLYLH